MRIDTLEAYNVAPDILRIWQNSIGGELLPVQERAVKEFGLFGDDNLIVFSPTSSGKTFVGEMAAVKAACENTKVFYLVPQKALAEEKFRELRRRYEPAGIRVVISSRDRREYDADIERRDFQIAVVVFEKLQALLVSRPQLMESVGLVVVDELQLITDPSRGPNLELLLTKLRLARRSRGRGTLTDGRVDGGRADGRRGAAPAGPRIVGLSAVLGRAERLAEWLGARLLVESRRPIELRKGVLCRGNFIYTEHNTGERGSESFDAGRGDPRRAPSRQTLILQTAAELAERDEQVLVFLPDRVSTVASARLLAEKLAPHGSGGAIDRLRQEEETHARDTLMEVLSRGVAFHNSDLSPEERRLVEDHFRSGDIRVLFSTSTLAMGMNLPVKNVILDGKRWQYLPRYGRWSLEDVSRSEYENMSGRAGRLSLTEGFGRSILITSSPFEADVWLKHYVGASFEDIVPTLQQAPLSNQVVNLLASGLARTRDELLELLLGSFTGSEVWSRQQGREDLTDGGSQSDFGAQLQQAVDRCVRGELARDDDEDGTLTITDLGRACASTGIGVDTAIAMARWAKRSQSVALSEIEILTVLSLTPAGRDIHVSMTSNERFRVDYRGELLRRAATAGVADRPVFRYFAGLPRTPEYELAKAVKKTLFLHDWVAEVRTKQIERRFRVWAGALRRIGEEYAWLAEALAACAQAVGWSSNRCEELQTFSARLVHGVRSDALTLARMRVPGLGRTLLRRLLAAGLSDPDALRAAGEEALRQVLEHPNVATALWEALQRPREAPPKRRPGAGPDPLAAGPRLPLRALPEDPPFAAGYDDGEDPYADRARGPLLRAAESPPTFGSGE